MDSWRRFRFRSITADFPFVSQRPPMDTNWLGAMYTMPKQRHGKKQLNQRVSVERRECGTLHTNLCMPPRGRAEDRGNWAKFGLKGSITTQGGCDDAGGKFHPSIFGWMVARVSLRGFARQDFCDASPRLSGLVGEFSFKRVKKRQRGCRTPKVPASEGDPLQTAKEKEQRHKATATPVGAEEVKLYFEVSRRRTRFGFDVGRGPTA